MTDADLHFWFDPVCPFAWMTRRWVRLVAAQRAYDVQVSAGLEGAAKFTALGLGLAVLGHNTWPFFR